MNKLIKIILSICILSVLFGSCTPPAYIPNMTSTPVFTGKGELVANLGAGTGGGETQVAYSISNHIGVMCNGNFSDYNEFSEGDRYHKHNFLEFGTGYYNAFNSSVFEVYGGYGFGEIYDRFNENEMSRATANKFFIQPSISAFSENFEISFSPRVSLVNVNIDGVTTGDYELFIEPTITGRAGFKYMKFFVQSGRIFSATSSELPYKYRSRIFVIGLQFHFGKKSGE